MSGRVHIDKFGRVVIPKSLRERFGLHPGTPLSIEAGDDHLALVPEREEPLLARRDGVLVYRGVAAGDVAGALERHRRSRLRNGEI